MGTFAVSKYDIKQLHVFTKVVEHEGVTAAAHNAGVDLSTISRDLSALESRLGVKLCRRGRGGFALTPQGESIYRATVELLSRLQVFEQEVRATQETIGDRINFGVIDNVVTNHGSGIVATLSKMHRDHPETLVNVSVHEVSSIDVLVRERRIDIGVTGQPAWLQPLQYTPASFEEDRLYVSRTSPHFDEIMAAFCDGTAAPPDPVPYIARSYRTDVFQEFEHRHPLKVVGMGSTLEAILAAVLAGVGCALLPMHFVRGERCDDLVEIPLAGPAISVQLYLVSRRDAVAQPAVRAFMKCFNEVVAACGEGG